MAIAFFYAVGTAAGGISGPLVFAELTEPARSRDTVLAFQIGAGLMCAAGLVAAFLAVNGGTPLPGGHRHAAVGGEAGGGLRADGAADTCAGALSDSAGVLVGHPAATSGQVFESATTPLFEGCHLSDTRCGCRSSSADWTGRHVEVVPPHAPPRPRPGGIDENKPPGSRITPRHVSSRSAAHRRDPGVRHDGDLEPRSRGPADMRPGRVGLDLRPGPGVRKLVHARRGRHPRPAARLLQPGRGHHPPGHERA